jgi:hypothetical protein
MKTGRSLQQLAAELERQSTNRTDYIAPQGKIAARVLEGEVVLDGFNGKALDVTNHAHGQLATHLSIPKAYYDRMREERPGLLVENINTWLHKDAENERMIRTLDGRVRAVMSPRYRPLDNYELASAILPTLIDRGVQVMSAELTETRLYIKGILPELSDTLPTGMAWGEGHNNVLAPRNGRVFGGDGKIVSAIVISNSEVGAGALRVEPSVFTTFCTNLAILKAAAMKKYHVGRANTADESMEVYTDATRKQDDKAFFMKVNDVVRATFNRAVWEEAVASIRQAAATPIESTDLLKVVERTVQVFALPKASTSDILTPLARGGDLSQWGLSSAITSAANEREDYEDATAFERAGGEVLALTGRDWKQISAAA